MRRYHFFTALLLSVVFSACGGKTSNTNGSPNNPDNSKASRASLDGVYKLVALLCADRFVNPQPGQMLVIGKSASAVAFQATTGVDSQHICKTLEGHLFQMSSSSEDSRLGSATPDRKQSGNLNHFADYHRCWKIVNGKQEAKPYINEQVPNRSEPEAIAVQFTLISNTDLTVHLEKSHLCSPVSKAIAQYKRL